MSNALAVQSVVQQMFCGDEVKANVIDLGSQHCRFGFAGQDTPRYRFRSDVGVVSSESDVTNVKSSTTSSSSSMDIDGGYAAASQKNQRYICGDQNLRYIRSDIEIEKPFSRSPADDSVEINWDKVEALLQYGTCDLMAVDPKEYPMLFAENEFKTYKDKNNLYEIVFETMDAPASWIAHNAVMSAFSSGRTTACVVDLGASGTRITPVVDGFTLNKSIMETSRGGDSIDTLVSAALANSGIAVQPWFAVSKKNNIDESSKGKGKSKVKVKSNELKVSESLRAMHSRDVVRDVKKWMSFVPYMPVPTENRHKFITEVIKLPEYELPDGTMISHNDDICTGAEKLFFSNEIPSIIAKPRPGIPAHNQPLEIDAETASLPELVRAAILKSDVDCRKDLLANTCLVGGGALIDGMQPRLQLECGNMFPPHMKCKVQVQLPTERLNAAWIGGSILGICGSFQQMWISKEEYLEYGDTLFAHRLH
jgi:actin-like protein 6A